MEGKEKFKCASAQCSYWSNSHYQTKRHMSRCRHMSVTTSATILQAPVRVPAEPSTQQVNAEADEPPFVNHQYSDYAPSAAPPFIRKICDVLVKTASKGCRKEVEELIHLLSSDEFDTATFKTFVKSYEYCEGVTISNSNNIEDEKWIHDEGFKKVPISAPFEMSGTPVLYMKDAVDVLRKQIALARDDDIILRCRNEGTSGKGMQHPMQTSFLRGLEDDMKRRVKSSKSSETFWSDTWNRHGLSFVAFLQLNSDKTATVLKANGLVMYPFHVILMNVTLPFRHFLIDKGYTLTGFLPVGRDSRMREEGIEHEERQTEIGSSEPDGIIPLKDYVNLTSASTGRVDKMDVLHTAIGHILSTFSAYKETGFQAYTRSRKRIWCHPVIVSYCCDLPEAKDVSGIRHGMNHQHPCIRCLSTPEEMKIKRIHVKRTIAGTFLVREEIAEIESTLKTREPPKSQEDKEERRERMKNIKKSLDKLSLSNWTSILESASKQYAVFSPTVYDIFTFEPLHNLSLGMSKMLKICFATYITSDKLIVYPGTKKQKSGAQMKTAILRGCNSLLAAFQAQYPIPGIQLDFAKKEGSSTLNGLFTEDGVKGMLEGKHWKGMDFAFPFLAANVDRWIGRETSCEQTKVHSLYTDVSKLLWMDSAEVCDDLKRMTDVLDNLKQMVIDTFKDHCEKGLFTLKFHLLDHLVDDIARFKSLHYIDASPFEKFNRRIKKAFRETSMRYSTRMEETVAQMGPTLKKARLTYFQGARNDATSISSSESFRNSLVRDGSACSMGNILDMLKQTDGSVHVPDDIWKHVRSWDEGCRKTFGRLLKEHYADLMTCGFEDTIDVSFVKTANVCGGFVPTLEDYDEEKNMLRFTSKQYKRRIQRVFAAQQFGSGVKPKYSYVLLDAGEKCTQEVWVGKVKALVRVTNRNTSKSDEMVYVQYMQVTPPIDNVDKALNCVCLRWATDDEVDHTVGIQPVRTISVGEWFGMIPVGALKGVVHVLRSNMAVHPFTEEKPWPMHRFYLNRFYCAGSMAEISSEASEYGGGGE